MYDVREMHFFHHEMSLGCLCINIVNTIEKMNNSTMTSRAHVERETLEP
jgi:hypothetical protein